MVSAIQRGQSAKRDESKIYKLSDHCLSYSCSCFASSSKPKAELDLYTNKCVYSLVIHNHDTPVNIYSYDPKDGHRSGHQFVQCHMVFDIKMEDLRCKARVMAVNYISKAP